MEVDWIWSNPTDHQESFLDISIFYRLKKCAIEKPERHGNILMKEAEAKRLENETNSLLVKAYFYLRMFR